jgi:hypothetical protein
MPHAGVSHDLGQEYQVRTSSKVLFSYWVLQTWALKTTRRLHQRHVTRLCGIRRPLMLPLNLRRLKLIWSW